MKRRHETTNSSFSEQRTLEDFGVLCSENEEVGGSRMTRTTSEPPLPSPYFRIPPVGEVLAQDVRFNMHQVHMHGGSSVQSSLEPGILGPRSRDLPLVHRGARIIESLLLF
ncbi:hypothetical protein AVEN_9970-1 [Araneus ventricosus]|uniref:Uncharacterized protein n=1 Tax=Araneus ventricosus TaxID=182803 RepID=A0A4Y2FB46_ARAVE|nr:hypothetical protein AVEN_9970-1 [Araneus ventricosus]